MAIMLLYSCAQIETSVRDLGAARAFMQNVLGAGKIEQQLAKEIIDLFPNGEWKIDHLGCGEAIFQINEPSPAADYRGQKSIHQAYLDRIGSCVTNLNYFVDDAVHAHELLTKMGAEIYLQGPSSAARCLADYGPENTRPGGDVRSFYFIGSRDLIGLDLELMEPNFQRFEKQTIQYPCFVQPRPVTGDENLRLLRLRLVVRDLEKTYKNLTDILAPGSRSKPYAFREGSLARAFRIGIGGIELEYCQPVSRKNELGHQLDRYGPGVLAIEFAARHLQRILAKSRDPSSLEFAEERDLVGNADFARGRYQIGSRDLIGFDVVLEKSDDRPLIGNC